MWNLSFSEGRVYLKYLKRLKLKPAAALAALVEPPWVCVWNQNESFHGGPFGQIRNVQLCKSTVRVYKTSSPLQQLLARAHKNRTHGSLKEETVLTRGFTKPGAASSLQSNV